MKLKEAFKPNPYVKITGIFKDMINLVQDGFQTASTKEPKYIQKKIDKIDGFIGEIQLDHRSYDDYSVVTNIHIVADMRRKGFAKMLYNEALKLAKKQGKLGIASAEYMRNEFSNPLWKKYSQARDEELDLDIITKNI